MTIILEGSDASGKSTLANALAKKFNMDIVKGSSFEISKLGPCGMYEYMNKLLDRDNVIIDRLYASNAVYGKLYNYPMLDKMMLDLLEEKRVRKQVWTLYLHADDDIIKERLNTRGDDMVRFEEIKDIKEEYNLFYRNPFKKNNSYLINVSTNNGINALLDDEGIKRIIKPLV